MGLIKGTYHPGAFHITWMNLHSDLIERHPRLNHGANKKTIKEDLFNNNNKRFN
jgi:hypothetical protein